MTEQPTLGISGCLLGQQVRFNGEGKRDRWITDELSKVVKWASFCPEMTMGLGAPRPVMRLVRESREAPPSLRITHSSQDLTEAALLTAEKILPELVDCDGFILKRASPSCGLESVKVYGKDGIPSGKISGIFGAKLKEAYPNIPVIEEGRLNDPSQREHFVIRVFANWRLKKVPADIYKIQAFHQSHKLLLMSHHPGRYRELGDIAANRDRRDPVDVLDCYRLAFHNTLASPSSRGRRVNALHHVFGYFKDRVDQAEKRQIIAVIESYQSGTLPFIVPVTLLWYLAEKFSVTYLQDQIFFRPYPERLKLREAW